MSESPEYPWINNTTTESYNFTAETVSSGDSDLKEYGRMINVVCRPILIILGTLGNGLAFMVMSRESMKKLTTCFYLRLLAVFDTGLLWVGAFPYWIGYLTRWRVNPETWTDCKLEYFLFSLFQHVSSCLLIAMSADRCFQVYFPIRANIICQIKMAQIISAAIVLLFVGFEAQWFFTVEARTGKCEFLYPEYNSAYLQVDAVLYSYMPFALMIVFNSAIIFKMYRAGKDKSDNQASSLSKAAKGATLMLLTVSFVFIVLTAPLSTLSALNRTGFTALPPVTHALLVTLMYLNHSCNFLLYCLSGQKFRSETKLMLGIRSNSVASNRGPTTATTA